MTRDELAKVREWANEKLATGEEPPWAWFQYMKLREVIDQIMAGQDAVTLQTESSLQSVPHREMHLRLVGSIDQQDNAPHHLVDEPGPMPM